MGTPRIVITFYDWSKQRIKNKCMCVICKGHYCYPSIGDRACRMCFEEYMRGEGE